MTPLARFGVAAALLALGLPLSQAVRGLAAWSTTNPARLGFEMLGIEIGLVALAVAGAFLLPGSPRRRLGLEPGRLGAPTVALLCLGTLGLSHGLGGLISMLPGERPSVMVGIAQGLAGAEGWPLVIALLGAVVGPALGEELLCRGLIQRTLRNRVGPWVAILASTAVFGVLHMEVIHGVTAAIIGLYLGFTAEWSDSTRPAILAHGANNLAALLGSTGILAVGPPDGASTLLGLGLALGAFVWVMRRWPRGGAGGTSLQAESRSAEA